MRGTQANPAAEQGKRDPGADQLYTVATAQFGPALARVARAYEADPDKRRDLLQEMHFQLWRSFHHYDARCSLSTWVYRVAHHVAVSHVLRERRSLAGLVTLEDLETLPETGGSQLAANQRRGQDQKTDLDRISNLIGQLKPLDRQVIISYLEELDARTIAGITGLSPSNVAVRIHRIKKILAKQFREGRPVGGNYAG